MTLAPGRVISQTIAIDKQPVTPKNGRANVGNTSTNKPKKNMRKLLFCLWDSGSGSESLALHGILSKMNKLQLQIGNFLHFLPLDISLYTQCTLFCGGCQLFGRYFWSI